MADILITKSRGKKYIGGSSPMVPAFIVGDDPIPLNPPGSIPTTLFKLLGDVTDSSFVGKNGFVPVVVDENVLTLENLDNKYVTIATAQTITGAKTFSLDNVINGINIGTGGGSIVSNIRIGQNALNSNTSGYWNSAVGGSALLSNTTGYANAALGLSSLRFNTTGSYNTGVGVDALRSVGTGMYNVALGAIALNSVEGSYNTALGSNAGAKTSSGSSNTVSNDSIFLGFDTRPLVNNQTNQIVIGNNAVGAGSNTVVLGNASIIKTILQGTINMAGLPISSTGLVTGDVWNNGGVLNIV